MRSHKEDDAYRALQRHLDRQPVGFPATRSGVELRLLKHLFTPEEARLAVLLTHKPRPLEQIRQEADAGTLPLPELQAGLDAMARRGVVGCVERQGSRRYFNLPLVVGMYETQLYQLTPQFLADFEEYTSHWAFGLDFLSTARPQMRTIPAEKSVRPEHRTATYDQLEALLAESNGPFVINECMCRKSAAMKGRPCQATARLETCLAMGDIARYCVQTGMGREICREEALEISRRNEAQGLVLQPSNARKPEFICACCGCCCGILQMHKKLPNPASFWAANHRAQVDAESCTGCGACAELCQVEAVAPDPRTGVAAVDPRRCIGCGNCVARCPADALRLVKAPRETVPPPTWEDLYEDIMARKKEPFRKVRTAARLILKR